MAHQVRRKSLVVIAKDAQDAIDLYDRLSRAGTSENMSVRDMDGKAINPDDLRAAVKSENDA